MTTSKLLAERTLRQPMLVTLEDIARVAGVTKATVSRALNERPCVAPATRARVLAAASRLGYEPDAALRALSLRRWRTMDHPFKFSVALVHMQSGRDAELLRSGRRALMFPAIWESAAKAGIRISEFYLPDHGSVSRLSAVLRARGIEGVLLNITQPVVEWAFDWAQLSVVSLGLGCGSAFQVCSDWFGAVCSAVHEARRRGYVRIGHVELVHGNPGNQDQIGAGIAFCERRLLADLGPQPRTLVLKPREDPTSTDRRQALFERWLEDERPDVIIDGAFVAKHFLESRGWKPGDRPALINLVRRFSATHEAIASIDHNFQEQGRLAVETLASLMQHRIRGKPALPARLVVPCSWHDGASLPAATADSPRTSRP